MKLVKLEVQNYRSLFADAAGRHLVLDLGDGVNCIVGPNNCGKSNIFRALAVALDPDFRFDRAKDMPASTAWAKPTITLTFHVPRRGRGNSESTLLRHLESYERSAQPNARATYASQGIVKYKVTIEGGEDSVGRRRATFVASGAGAISLPDEDPLAKRAIAQFHKCLHFVLIESGQSLGSLLEGKFRDFLRSVLNDELRADYRAAERHRAEYVERIQSGLLQPLTTRIMKELKELFPEVTAVSLRPDVGDLEDTLARMHVDVTDLMETDLADKGTGVRGGVLVAMLRHLADASRRSMLFAIEEPEAFLHPGAQERLREDLEQLAKRADVSLLVTTHSPFIVSRREEARVFALDKNTDGRTEVVASATGAQPQAGVLGGLFRDRLIVDVLDRAAAVPASARAVVVVEGDTDECYLRLAAERAGRPELIADLTFVQAGTGIGGEHAGGAALAAMQALVTKATAGVPVVAIFDNDEPGREAHRMLRLIGEKTKEWKDGRTLFTYRVVFPASSGDFPFEAEDLWPNHLVEAFIAERGEDGVLKRKQVRPNPIGGWQYDLDPKVKGDFVEFLRQQTAAKDTALWVDLIGKIRSGLGLPDPVAPAATTARELEEPLDLVEETGGEGGRLHRAVWPLPGGRAHWKESLDEMLSALVAGPMTVAAAAEWLVQRYPTVTSERGARSYWIVPAAFDLVSWRRGMISLTALGKDYLTERRPDDLGRAILGHAWGVREMLEHLAVADASTSELAEVLNDLGARWETDRQVVYRLRWLEHCGWVERDRAGLWKATPTGAWALG